jgi:hypothetical protein
VTATTDKGRCTNRKHGETEHCKCGKLILKHGKGCVFQILDSIRYYKYSSIKLCIVCNEIEGKDIIALYIMRIYIVR